MKHLLRCPYCNFDRNPFEEEDRGFEIYCCSCARAIPVPMSDDESAPSPESAAGGETRAAPPAPGESVASAPTVAPAGLGPVASPGAAAPASEPEPQVAGQPAALPTVVAPPSGPHRTDNKAAAPQTRRGVFGGRGLADLEEQVIGEQTCLCGARVPVRLADVGGTVYCSKCFSELQVTATYGQKSPPVDDEPPALPAPRPRLRLIRSPLTLAGLAIVLLAGLSGGYLTWQNAGRPIGTIIDLSAVPDEELGDGATEPEPPMAKAEAEPVAKPEPRAPEPPPPEPEITRDMVEALAHSQDLAVALVQAQIWEERLRDQDVPSTDARRIRLAELIKRLEERLSPKPPGPPASLPEFQKRLDEIALALKGGDLPRAKTALQEAERFLEEHQDELGSYGQRLFLLKARVLKEVALIEGVQRVYDWQDQVEKLLAEDKVTEALAAEAQARFLAFSSYLSADDRQKLDQRARELQPRLRQGLGKRAVDDAVRAAADHDIEARDYCVRRALSLLPGLPEGDIRPLMARVEPWADAARQKADPPNPAKSRSRLIREFERRNRYEAVIQAYGNVELAPLAEAGERFLEVVVPSDADHATMRTRVERLLFGCVDQLAGIEFEQLAAEQDQAAFLLRLDRVRRMLAVTEKWKGSHRWKAVDGLLRQQGSRLGQQILKDAEALAKEDKLAEAVEKATQAQGLGTAATAQRAAGLLAQWQAELKLRADRQAHDESWQRIQQLQNDPQRRFELYRELVLFVRRFPSSPRADEVRQRGVQTRRELEGQVAGELEEIGRRFDRQEWGDARRRMNLLADTPIPPPSAEKYRELQQRLADLKSRASREFLLLDKRKRLTAEEDVIAALRVLPQVVTMDPDHEEAQALLKRAQEQGALRAEKLVSLATLFRTAKPELWRDKLRKAAKLDPDGPWGRKAQELLAGA